MFLPGYWQLALISSDHVVEVLPKDARSFKLIVTRESNE